MMSKFTPKDTDYSQNNSHFITKFTVHLMWLVLVPITIVQDK